MVFLRPSSVIFLRRSRKTDFLREMAFFAFPFSQHFSMLLQITGIRILSSSLDTLSFHRIPFYKMLHCFIDYITGP